MAMPADQLPIGEGLLPDGSLAPFYISRTELDTVQDEGPEEKYRDARFIPMAIREPDVIFAGLRRPNETDSWCYCVRPTREPDDDDDEEEEEWAEPSFLEQPDIPIRSGEVFLAFVRLANMGYVVFDWEWREECEDDGCHPANHTKDFRRIAWSRP